MGSIGKEGLRTESKFQQSPVKSSQKAAVVKPTIIESQPFPTQEEEEKRAQAANEERLRQESAA